MFRSTFLIISAYSAGYFTGKYVYDKDDVIIPKIATRADVDEILKEYEKISKKLSEIHNRFNK